MITGWEFFWLSLLALASWVYLMGESAPSQAEPVAKSFPTTSLTQLQAMVRERLEAMEECRFELKEQFWGEERVDILPDSSTLELPGQWVHWVLEVAPRDSQKMWWPCGISLECPEFLRERDALSAETPARDLREALERALYRRLVLVAQGDAFEARQDCQTLTVRAYVPDCCKELELGYYGRPCLRLTRSEDDRFQSG